MHNQNPVALQPVENEDRALIAKILTGDMKAFRVFIARYERLVSHIVFRMVANNADREELCQDIFIKAYRSLTSFQFQCKLATWVAKIAYNTALNYLKKKRIPLFEDLLRSKREHADGTAAYQMTKDFSESVFTASDSPDALVEARELTEQVQSEIALLPAHFRTVLTLFHLDNMSYEEIAAITNLPQGTIKSHLFRARKLLKERLLTKFQPEDLWQ